MREIEEEASEASQVQFFHKEEAKAMIREDTKDRIGLRRKL
jgi:hypothetical protein